MVDKIEPGKPKGMLKDLVRAESLIQLAITLPAATLIGWLGGHWLDTRFGTKWIGVVGILLGAAAGFIQIYNVASKYMKRND